ncbi:carbon-nitrogen hydrolase [Vararia minispora EC-137]|uniref:Carbon-nitrogen hydrolase n=1 Tax=Vararia minispora EC-137 TaxID=1314806 RepID=A0ACB8QCN0_9AGAM|nr:carbon-nitrogen hydrolase [Vararia minispora EC-137]
MATNAPEFKPFKLALIQLGQVTNDKAANLKHAREMIRKAVAGEGVGAQSRPGLVVLPECFNSPYGIKSFPIHAEEIGFKRGEKYDISGSKSDSVKMLSSAAKEEGIWLLGGSIPERDTSDNKLYNTATVYSPQGDLVAIHRKVHLFDIDIPGKITFKESETLTGGNSFNYFDTGPLLPHLRPHATDSARIGLGICYDVRFPEQAMVAARQGAQVCIYPGAFNTTTGPLHWELLARARALDNEVYFALCSPARDLSADYHAWGHSMIVDPMGVKLIEAGAEETIVHASIDPQKFREARTGIPVTVQRRFDVYPDVSKGF